MKLFYFTKKNLYYKINREIGILRTLFTNSKNQDLDSNQLKVLKKIQQQKKYKMCLCAFERKLGEKNVQKNMANYEINNLMITSKLSD